MKSKLKLNKIFTTILLSTIICFSLVLGGVFAPLSGTRGGSSDNGNNVINNGSISSTGLTVDDGVIGGAEGEQDKEAVAITTAPELAQFLKGEDKYAGKNGYLADNINDFNWGAQVVSTIVFDRELDGRGYTINMTASNEGLFKVTEEVNTNPSNTFDGINSIGLFVAINNGVIKNTNFTQTGVINIETEHATFEYKLLSFGVVAGTNQGTIENCSLKINNNITARHNINSEPKDGKVKEKQNFAMGGMVGRQHGSMSLVYVEYADNVVFYAISEKKTYQKWNTTREGQSIIYVGGVAGTLDEAKLNDKIIVKASSSVTIKSFCENKDDVPPEFLGGKPSVSYRYGAGMFGRNSNGATNVIYDYKGKIEGNTQNDNLGSAISFSGAPTSYITTVSGNVTQDGTPNNALIKVENIPTESYNIKLVDNTFQNFKFEANQILSNNSFVWDIAVTGDYNGEYKNDFKVNYFDKSIDYSNIENQKVLSFDSATMNKSLTVKASQGTIGSLKDAGEITGREYNGKTIKSDFASSVFVKSVGEGVEPIVVSESVFNITIDGTISDDVKNAGEYKNIAITSDSANEHYSLVDTTNKVVIKKSDIKYNYSITKKAVTITAQDMVYDFGATIVPKATYEGLVEGESSLPIKFKTEPEMKVGTQTVSLDDSIVEFDNYTATYAKVDAQLTINKIRIVDVKLEGNKNYFTYGDDINIVATFDTPFGDTIILDVKYFNVNGQDPITEEQLKNLPVGKYLFKVNINEKDIDNYEFANGENSLSQYFYVQKAEVNYTVDGAKDGVITFDYNKSLKENAYVPTLNLGEFESLKEQFVITYGYDQIEKSNINMAGEFTFNVSFAGNENYMSSYKTYKVVVNQAKIDVDFSEFTNGYEKMYDRVEYTHKLSDNTLKALLDLGITEEHIKYSPNTFKDAGNYKVTLTIDEPNFEKVELTAEVKIEALDMTLEDTGLKFRNKYYTYGDGETRTMEVTGDNVEFYTITYDYTPEEIASFVNAGEYIITATISKPNYKDLVISAKLIVSPAQFDEELIDSWSVQGGTKEYDGEPMTAKFVGELPEGATGTFIGGASKTSAGKHTITYKVSKPNYKDVTIKGVIEITPKQVEVTYVFGSDKYKEGDKIIARATYVDVKGNVVTTDVIMPSMPKAGTYEVKVVINDANYVATANTVTFDFELRTIQPWGAIFGGIFGGIAIILIGFVVALKVRGKIKKQIRVDQYTRED